MKREAICILFASLNELVGFMNDNSEKDFISVLPSGEGYAVLFWGSNEVQEVNWMLGLPASHIKKVCMRYAKRDLEGFKKLSKTAVRDIIVREMVEKGIDIEDWPRFGEKKADVIRKHFGINKVKMKF